MKYKGIKTEGNLKKKKKKMKGIITLINIIIQIRLSALHDDVI
jgi:hypothetical protein